MARIEELRSLLSEMSEDDGEGAPLLFESPDFDRSVIGAEEGTGRVVYDYDLMVAEMSEEAGIEPDEAMEFIDYNTMRALAYADPERRPIVIRRITADDYMPSGRDDD